jgi:hypothetical protein
MTSWEPRQAQRRQRLRHPPHCSVLEKASIFLAIDIRPEEKKLFERAEHVEGVRYEIVLTSHAVYVERQVSVMSQWVGGMLLAIFLHVIGAVVQYVLLRGAHESMRIPWRNLRSTGIRRVPRHIVLLLGIGIALVLPFLIAIVGGVLFSFSRSQAVLQLFQALAVVSFFVACIATVILMIRFPRTALVLGSDWRNLEFHSLGDEAALREIADRVITIQERVAVSSGRSGASAARTASDSQSAAAPSPSPGAAAAPLPGPQSRR